jgi:hypothetical protein
MQGLSSALGHAEIDIATRGAAWLTIASTEILAFIPPSHTLFDSLKKRPFFRHTFSISSNGICEESGTEADSSGSEAPTSGPSMQPLFGTPLPFGHRHQRIPPTRQIGYVRSCSAISTISQSIALRDMSQAYT